MQLITDEVEIVKLCKAIGVSYANMYYYVNGLRKWNLETWIDTLAALGHVTRVTDDNKVIITCSMRDIDIKRIEKIRRKWRRLNR